MLVYLGPECQEDHCGTWSTNRRYGHEAKMQITLYLPALHFHLSLIFVLHSKISEHHAPVVRYIKVIIGPIATLFKI